MWRRIFQVLFILLIVAVAAFVVGGMLLPSTVHVERTIAIQARPEAVYDEVCDFRRWPAWSPWHSEDPHIVLDYGTIASGRGAAVAWNSNRFGKGRLQIASAEEAQSLHMAIEFDQRGRSASTWRFEPERGGRTIVTWSADGSFGGNYAVRYMGFYLRQHLEKKMQEGLENLKRLCESKPRTNPAMREPGPASASASGPVPEKEANEKEKEKELPRKDSNLE